MESLATYLKQARELKQVSLEQVSRETRISLHHLQNLEAGRYKDLPGGMYNRAFIKSYCECLRIDPRDMLDRYDAETAPPKEKSAKAKPRTPEIGATFKLHPMIIWGTMLLVSVGGLYLSRGWVARTFSPYFSHPTVPELTADSPKASIPAPQPKESAEAPPVIPASTEAVPASVGPALPNEADSQVARVEPGTIRIEFEVLQECWVSVNRDGDRVLVKILEPGDDQTFSASEKFFLVLGNAGGVRLKINGKPAKPLGKPGEVVKVLINEQNIKDLIENSSG